MRPSKNQNTTPTGSGGPVFTAVGGAVGVGEGVGGSVGSVEGGENKINNLINPLGFRIIKAEQDIFYGILARYLRL